MSKRPSRKPIEIKISTVVAVSAILNESNLGVLDAAMQEMTGGNVDFFEDEFTVIDVGSLDSAHQAIDWHAITTLLKAYRLNAVAVRNATPEMEADILAHGLSLDGPVKPRAAVVAATPEQAEIELEPAEEIADAIEVALPIQATTTQASSQVSAAQFAANTMIVDTPVRAGQRIYARGADLIITAAVNNGAEVIADGSIHIYAPLRGRALAGASGNTEARICFPPDRKQQATQIRLIGDRIDMLPIKSAA
jgi:septum site-determining protein MinC